MTSATSDNPQPSTAAPETRVARFERLSNPQRRKPRGLAYWVGRAYMAAMGWKVVGGNPEIPRAVVIACPHTTNWDLTFSIATGWILGVEIHWLGKDSLFKPPLGWLMKLLNGIPVDRSKRNNLVGDAASKLRNAEHLFIMVPPEGTRGVSKRWKTGFYYIAVEADVPIICGFLDYKRKESGLGALLYPSGDIHSDFHYFQEFYGPIEGKFNELKSPISLGEDTAGA